MIYSLWHFCCNLERSILETSQTGMWRIPIFVWLQFWWGFTFTLWMPLPPSLPASVTLLWKAESHGCFSSFVMVSEILLQVKMVPPSYPGDMHLNIMCRLWHTHVIFLEQPSGNISACWYSFQLEVTPLSLNYNYCNNKLAKRLQRHRDWQFHQNKIPY